MALLTQVVYCTEENKKHTCLYDCLSSIYDTVDFRRHKMVIVDNGSAEQAKKIIEHFQERVGSNCAVVTLPENIGTARGINKAWIFRGEKESCVKVDDDVVFEQSGWLDHLEDAAERLWRGYDMGRPGGCRIGLLGLKRKDLGENQYFPQHPDGSDGWGSTDLWTVDHLPGERHYCFERVKTNPLMGTCVLHHWRLLNEVGFMYQANFLYGFDDTIMSWRARTAGFHCGFLYGRADINHIDPGGTPYQERKSNGSDEQRAWIEDQLKQFQSGKMQVYRGPEED